MYTVVPVVIIPRTRSRRAQLARNPARNLMNYNFIFIKHYTGALRARCPGAINFINYSSRKAYRGGAGRSPFYCEKRRLREKHPWVLVTNFRRILTFYRRRADGNHLIIAIPNVSNSYEQHERPSNVSYETSIAAGDGPRGPGGRAGRPIKLPRGHHTGETSHSPFNIKWENGD